ncbi:hypothetical protein GCM10025876_27410 [Demequina litorisediminis]|uniref:Helix-turn-helix domain-containing protein n=1 Tax=Demequina litorisediminis TaxID=1849022 RepID=A0ABQ6IF67_9MICO|nr:hypothetical protein GCM10025876_27410 [Demequina litorisediminis]
MAPRFLKIEDVQEILNVSSQQAYALVRSGELPAIQVGGRGVWRVEASEPRGVHRASVCGVARARLPRRLTPLQGGDPHKRGQRHRHRCGAPLSHVHVVGSDGHHQARRLT